MRQRAFAMKFTFLLLMLSSIFAGSCYAGQRYADAGLVLTVDRARHIVIVSCDSISDVMEAMVIFGGLSPMPAPATLSTNWVTVSIPGCWPLGQIRTA